MGDMHSLSNFFFLRSLALVAAASFFSFQPAMSNFFSDVDVTWGGGRAAIAGDGQQLSLSMDRASGSGFQSKNEFLYGKFDVTLKLIPGNSAGTVTAYYLSCQGPKHDEVDMEFLGNLSGQPYILHTNLYTEGQGNREQQFYLWFDPTQNFHTYTILWNPYQIMFYVDGTPVRVYKNMEPSGIPYPSKQPMRLYSSLWDAEDWATRGGLVKTDWSQAPFTAQFRDLTIEAGAWTGSAAWINRRGSRKLPAWMNQGLVNSYSDQEKLAWVQKNYMVYNYCNDLRRFPQGLPKECSTVMAFSPPLSLHLHLLLFSAVVATAMADFNTDVDILWGRDHTVITNQGQEIRLSLDGVSGSGFQSRQQFFYGRFDMKMKLVPGNSAGTVASFYVSQDTSFVIFICSFYVFIDNSNWHGMNVLSMQLAGSGWSKDEIDLEFLGNLSGQPYTLHTNVYTQGKGEREQQFYLWFDPTIDFHAYSILWTPFRITLYVDGVPIRIYKNRESMGIPYPNKQAMRVHSSIWNADWATRGGLVKVDWAQAPFTIAFRDLVLDACVSYRDSPDPACKKTYSASQLDPGVHLSASDQAKLAWVRKNYMIYNYCTDAKRFPQGWPKECSLGLYS
ncbi:putative xyloglucan endotransglucosylase/hydrolase protein 23 [Nymphaea thermarum]|nr:putative xyloglucan endotransglucosylase/hydrolase protein 23 [Nymphaea thermarum]